MSLVVEKPESAPEDLVARLRVAIGPRHVLPALVPFGKKPLVGAIYGSAFEARLRPSILPYQGLATVKGRIERSNRGSIVTLSFGEEPTLKAGRWIGLLWGSGITLAGLLFGALVERPGRWILLIVGAALLVFWPAVISLFSLGALLERRRLRKQVLDALARSGPAPDEPRSSAPRS